jgi:hypothetical protein
MALSKDLAPSSFSKKAEPFSNDFFEYSFDSAAISPFLGYAPTLSGSTRLRECDFSARVFPLIVRCKNHVNLMLRRSISLHREFISLVAFHLDHGRTNLDIDALPVPNGRF